MRSNILRGALGLGLLVAVAACDTAGPAMGSTDAALAAPADARGGQTKVDVCHSASGSFSLLSVAAPAVDGHRGHGDALPGEEVPGMDGYAFDEVCAPVAVSTIPACVQNLIADAAVDGIGFETLGPWTYFSGDYVTSATLANSDGWYISSFTLFGTTVCRLFNFDEQIFYADSDLGTSGATELMAYLLVLGQ